jgi:rhamnose utilization protein RhaD (predicted bifunctional aldolase and dehydrogenase)
VKRRVAVSVLTLWLLVANAADLEVRAQGGRVTREEALAAVFPGAVVEAERVFLTERQMEEIAEIAGVEIESALVARYVATLGDTVLGRAYPDTHVVRTKRESLLISLEADGSVRRVDVTAFLEPRDYLAAEPWLRQYDGRPLDDDLALQRAIRPIAGATLTANATNAAVRRVLATDQVLEAARTEPVTRCR